MANYTISETTLGAATVAETALRLCRVLTFISLGSLSSNALPFVLVL